MIDTSCSHATPHKSARQKKYLYILTTYFETYFERMIGYTYDDRYKVVINKGKIINKKHIGPKMRKSDRKNKASIKL